MLCAPFACPTPEMNIKSTFRNTANARKLFYCLFEALSQLLHRNSLALIRLLRTKQVKAMERTLSLRKFREKSQEQWQ